MDGISAFFVIFFGIAAVIPATWSIIGLIQGNRKFWPGVVGAGWAVGLLLVTLIGGAMNWGGCSKDRSKSSEGAITCFVGDTQQKCVLANGKEITPDVWQLECGESSDDCPKNPPRRFCKPQRCVEILAGQFCPAGQKPVFPFCERVRTGGFKQQWAIWSDLSFIAAGLWLLWALHYFGTGDTINNPITKIGWLSVTYGLIVIFMGPPSQWFHASLKDWGGWFDTMSVVLWLMFNAVYVWYLLTCTMFDRGREIRTMVVLIVWAVLVIICGFIAIAPKARTALYFASGGPWTVAELVYIGFTWWHPGVKNKRNGWIFGLNFLVLLGTMTLWCFYNPDLTIFTSPTACQSREWFPGHAVFHIGASISTMVTLWSFYSEKRVSG